MEFCVCGFGLFYFMIIKDDVSFMLVIIYFDDQYLEDLLQFIFWNGLGVCFLKSLKIFCV